MELYEILVIIEIWEDFLEIIVQFVKRLDGKLEKIEFFRFFAFHFEFLVIFLILFKEKLGILRIWLNLFYLFKFSFNSI